MTTTNKQLLINLKRQLKTYEPKVISGDYPNAAVLIPIREYDGMLELILTVRAEHLNSHAGEIAFPGGKEEEQDASLIDTSLRETWEEIGLQPGNVEVISCLDQTMSKAGIRVLPVVGIVNQEEPMVANLDELDHIFTVPLSFFAENEPLVRTYTHKGNSWVMPEFQFGEYRIWGLTSMIIVDLINIVYQLKLPQYKRPDFIKLN